MGGQPGGVGSGLTRKGTGFVYVGELPPSDDDDEEDSPKPASKKVCMQEPADNKPHEKGSGAMQRKGTGFVLANELPDDDDEEDDEDEDTRKEKKPHFAQQEEKSQAAKAGGMVARKGTGFVSAADIPDTDDEDEEDAPCAGQGRTVGFKEDMGNAAKGHQTDGKVARKGTGFVNASEIAVDSDEEDED